MPHSSHICSLVFNLSFFEIMQAEEIKALIEAGLPVAMPGGW